jgi:hypothetical protein
MRRVTVTLPDTIVEQIDLWEANRSKLLTEAVRRELERRRQRELYRSLRSPHTDTAAVAELGMTEWGTHEESDDDLVASDAGRSIRWTPGSGWTEHDE